MADWESDLERCLNIGVASESLFEDIDEILKWFNAISNDERSSYSQKLLDHFGEAKLRENFEIFLDRLVIADDRAYRSLFTSALNEQIAKKRYRQLIRIFHPDKGANAEAWLNYRAERINVAYEKYENRDAVSGEIDFDQDTVLDAKVFDSSKDKEFSGNKLKMRYRPSVWRQRFGNPKDLQKRILFAIGGVSLVAGLILFASTIESPEDITDTLEASTDDNSRVPEISDLESSFFTEDATGSRLGTGFDELAEFQAPTNDAIEISDDEIAEIDAELAVLNQGEIMRLSGNAESLIANNPPNANDPASKTDIKTDVDINPLGSPAVALPEQPSENKQRSIHGKRVNSKPVAKKSVLPSQVKNTVAAVSSPKTVNRKLTLGEVATDKTAALQERNTGKPGNEHSLKPGEKVEKETRQSGVDIKIEVGEVVSSYRKHYMRGDLQNLLNLFITTGRVNDVQGADKVRKIYRDFFNSTTQRNIEFSIIEIRSDDPESALISGTINVSAITQNGKPWSPGIMVFKMALVRSDQQLKIAFYELHTI